jgi:formylglycine-generating enzyme required for sulfatase activity
LNRSLNAQFVDEAQVFADRYFQLTCGGDGVTRPNAKNGLWSDIGFDQSALLNPRCVSGSCSAGTLSCNPGASDGGSLGKVDAGFDGGPKCPGTAGPSMVRVPAPDGSTYCIDSTEVTNLQYFEFLQAKRSTDGGTDTSGQASSCSWNTRYDPGNCSGGYDPYARPDYPIGCVDWCDADAYCKWAGKRLCGKIGGGSTSFSEYADATKSEWFNACSAGGTMSYPYGNTYNGAACVGADYDGTNGYQSSDVPQPVGSATQCHGAAPPLDGVHDLGGNVWEWEDSCQGTTGGGDQCRLGGGSYVSVVAYLGCGYDYYGSREDQYEMIGFRCCGD